jgi:type VI secretion system secreted protein Hcp
LVARKAGKEQQEYMRITLSDMLVSSYHTSGSGGSDILAADGVYMSLGTIAPEMNLGAIAPEYKEQKPDGTLGGTTKMEFNLKTMKASAFREQKPDGTLGGFIDKGFDILKLKPW